MTNIPDAVDYETPVVSPDNAASADEPSTVTDEPPEVLQLIAAGTSNGVIADQLVISLNTVKRHVSNIFQKLNVTSRTAAIARPRLLHLI